MICVCGRPKGEHMAVPPHDLDDCPAFRRPEDLARIAEIYLPDLDVVGYVDCDAQEVAVALLELYPYSGPHAREDVLDAIAARVERVKARSI